MSHGVTLDQALAQLPALAGDREVSELPGGLTNHNYRVRTATQDVVVRISPPTTDLLAVNREHEWLNSRAAALAASAAYDDEKLTAAIIERYARFSPAEKDTAQSVLSSRLNSATALLDAVKTGSIPPDTIRPEIRDKMRLIAGGKLASRLDALFGGKIVAQPEQVRKEVARVLAVVSTPGGDPYRGRTDFEQTCAACHRLYGKGGQIGPDLTSFKRDDLPNIVLNIVNPSAEIREGYESFIVTAKDGSVYSGFLASQDKQRVVLRDMSGVNLTLEREKIATMNGVGRSLMPEGLLADKSDAALRDLFAYLRTTQPLQYNPRVSGAKN